MEIRRLVTNIFEENTYIIWDEGSLEAAVVDPGMQRPQEMADFVNFIRHNNLRLKYILLTHGHYDHILAVPGLQKRWPDLPVYCHPADLGTGDTVTMFGQSYPTVRSFGNVTPWKEGDRITVAGGTSWM